MKWKKKEWRYKARAIASPVNRWLLSSGPPVCRHGIHEGFLVDDMAVGHDFLRGHRFFFLIIICHLSKMLDGAEVTWRSLTHVKHSVKWPLRQPLYVLERLRWNDLHRVWIRSWTVGFHKMWISVIPRLNVVSHFMSFVPRRYILRQVRKFVNAKRKVSFELLNFLDKGVKLGDRVEIRQQSALDEAEEPEAEP